MRIDPPESPPLVSGAMSAASAAALPPEEPPGVFEASQGLRPMPYRPLMQPVRQASSGMVFLPIGIAPASRRRATTGASASAGGALAFTLRPRGFGMPRV